jgi:hypothetical protein
MGGDQGPAPLQLGNISAKPRHNSADFAEVIHNTLMLWDFCSARQR